jgi:hypothetical protein
LTALFISAALVVIYGELGRLRQMVLSSNKMLWKSMYPDEPPHFAKQKPAARIVAGMPGGIAARMAAGQSSGGLVPIR